MSYDKDDDLGKSLLDCYRASLAIEDAGGKRWEPGALITRTDAEIEELKVIARKLFGLPQ